MLYHWLINFVDNKFNGFCITNNYAQKTIFMVHTLFLTNSQILTQQNNPIQCQECSLKEKNLTLAVYDCFCHTKYSTALLFYFVRT